jgi:DNA-binding ferritin-like protein (Dps family)
MNLWETLTGSDLTREGKEFAARAEALPADYRAAWEQMGRHLSSYGSFTGRNLMPILDSALEMLEEAAADGQGIRAVLGEDIEGFCAALAGGERSRGCRDRWRAQLNRNVARKLSRLGG